LPANSQACSRIAHFPLGENPKRDYVPKMNLRLAHSGRHGFTLVELLVVVAILIVLAAMLYPTAPIKRRATTVVCLNNQKQLALGFIMFIDDHSYKFPWQLSITNAGTMELTAGNHAYPHYEVLSNYLNTSMRAQCLVCPTDKVKYRATNYFAPFDDHNISYFISLDATPGASFVLGGDRHLEALGKAVGNGSFLYTTNLALNWTRELHGQIKNGPVGGLSFADGHAEFVHTERLNTLFQNQQFAVDHLVVP
jgi:prepilin-type N-terminal cleavage/methylation domain-containing protein